MVGGGPLALEWAQGLRARGIELTYVLRGRGFLSGLLDPTGSDLVGSRLRAFGCDLRLDEEVAEVLGDPQGRVQGVRLRTGGTIPAQLVCAAIGIRTNAAFLQGSGVEVNRGVPVDDRQRTNVDGVFAAGDVAEVFELPHAGEPAPIVDDAPGSLELADRTLHSHAFVGVDYDLEPGHYARSASAARMRRTRSASAQRLLEDASGSTLRP